MRRRRRTQVADVLIVGGGTSGGVAGKHLAEAGLKVICLEQGDWVEKSAFAGDKSEYEILGSKRWHPNPNVRENREDYPCECSDADLPVLMYAGVGGTSLLFGGVWSRLTPSDFGRERSTESPTIGLSTMTSLSRSMNRSNTRLALLEFPRILPILPGTGRRCRLIPSTKPGVRRQKA